MLAFEWSVHFTIALPFCALCAANVNLQVVSLTCEGKDVEELLCLLSVIQKLQLLLKTAFWVVCNCTKTSFLLHLPMFMTHC